MAASEAQHVVNVSLKKIIASRSKRGGIDLHRNLLLASVLLKARDVCIAGTYDPGYPGDDGNQHDAAVANDDELDDDVDSRQVDVTVTSDTVPNCDETPEKDCQEGAKAVHWDVIPDQALEEWDFLGPDICSEQLEPEEGHQQKSDFKRPSNNGNVDDDGVVTDFTVLDVADIDLRTSGHHANSISRKRAIEIELDAEDCDRDSYSFSSPHHKKQKTDATVNCENMCMDFDDLINALEGDCSITTGEVRETSKDFVDKLSFSLDFPITCDSDHVCSVGETNALLSCQSSSASGFNISLSDAVLSSVA